MRIVEFWVRVYSCPRQQPRFTPARKKARVRSLYGLCTCLDYTEYTIVCPQYHTGILISRTYIIGSTQVKSTMMSDVGKCIFQECPLTVNLLDCDHPGATLTQCQTLQYWSWHLTARKRRASILRSCYLVHRHFKSLKQTVGYFTIWISLSLRLSLSPKVGLRPKISQKVKSLFVWTQRYAERFAETKLRTERSLNPKLINSSVDFACTR